MLLDDVDHGLLVGAGAVARGRVGRDDEVFRIEHREVALEVRVDLLADEARRAQP
jgi:hypothetical protein